jgi:ketosteroid isomerase-like protein
MLLKEVTMKIFSLFICAILGIFLNSADPVRALAQDELQEAVKQTKEINRIIEKAVKESDYETVLKYHTEDVIIKPDFVEAIKGKAELREQYRQNKKIGLKIHAYDGVVEAMWICGDKVYERGIFGMSFSSTERPQPEAAYGSYFQIWEKQEDNSYKVAYLIWNLDYNPFKTGN